jgi:hypothetical protein
MPLSLIPLRQLLSDFTYPTYVNFQSKVQRTGGTDTEQYVMISAVIAALINDHYDRYHCTYTFIVLWIMDSRLGKNVYIYIYIYIFIYHHRSESESLLIQEEVEGRPVYPPFGDQYIHIHVYMDTCVNICICTYTYICVYTCINICICLFL